MRLISSLGIGVVSIGAFVSAQQPGGPPAPAPSPSQVAVPRTGAISGVVRDSVTNRPIAGAVVSLGGAGSGRAGGGPTVELTDDKGRFVFAELAPYEGYALDVRKAGYFTGHYGRSSAGAPIALGDRQWMNSANVALNRPAVISGTITDEHGAPVAGAYVRLVREYPLAGRPHFAAGSVTQTDDRGAYRLSGLEPGRYVVITPNPQHAVPASPAAMLRMSGTSPQEAARLQAEGRTLSFGSLIDIDASVRLAVGRFPVPTPGPDGQPLSYRTLYFPDALSFDTALRLELRYGDERAGVDFQLRPVATVRVSGTAVGPPEALENMSLRLVPAGMEDLGGFGTEVATSPLGDGNRFTFLNVPAGAYLVVAKRATSEVTLGSTGNLPAPPSQGATFGMSMTLGAGMSPTPNDARLSTYGSRGAMGYAGRLPIDVGTDNVDGLVVSMQRGATLTARVVKEGNLPGNANLAIEPAQGNLSMIPAQNPGPPPANGVFTFEGLMPGQYFLRLRSLGLVKSITWEAQDYADHPFDVSDGKDVADVVVTITDQSGAISGVVRDRAGAPTTDAIVTVFPAEDAWWIDYGLTPARIKSTTTSTTGAYRITALPAGDYLLIAAMDIDPAAWREPGFLERAAPQATRFSVGWGERLTKDVRVSPVK